MNIDYTVTALMFPAIPLLMNIYSNRFHSLSKLIRELHDEHVYENHVPAEWKKQFINLSGRIVLLRWTIMFFIREIHISTNALKLHMSDMDVKVD